MQRDVSTDRYRDNVSQGVVMSDFEIDNSMSMTGPGLVFCNQRRIEYFSDFYQAIDAPSHIAAGSMWKHHDSVYQREILRDYM